RRVTRETSRGTTLEWAGTSRTSSNVSALRTTRIELSSVAKTDYTRALGHGLPPRVPATRQSRRLFSSRRFVRLTTSPSTGNLPLSYEPGAADVAHFADSICRFIARRDVCGRRDGGALQVDRRAGACRLFRPAAAGERQDRAVARRAAAGEPECGEGARATRSRFPQAPDGCCRRRREIGQAAREQRAAGRELRAGERRTEAARGKPARDLSLQREGRARSDERRRPRARAREAQRMDARQQVPGVTLTPKLLRLLLFQRRLIDLHLGIGLETREVRVHQLAADLAAYLR